MSSPSSSSSSSNNTRDDVKPATKFLESAGRLLVAGEFDALERLMSDTDLPSTPAVHLVGAMNAYYLDRKNDSARMCREILGNNPSKHLEALARYYLVFSLEDADAEAELRLWIDSAPSEISAILKDTRPDSMSRLRDVIKAMAVDQDTLWFQNFPPPKNSDVVSCSYCGITFSDKNDLRAHIQTDEHQKVLMSDEGRDWTWRAPPRGHSAESYVLCENFAENQICHYGSQCADAHGMEELNEWKERLEYRKTRLQRAKEKELYGKSYTEQLLEKWIQASNPDKIMKERIDEVEDSCSADLSTTVASKTSKSEWVFKLKTKKPLRAVALLQDAHRNHFSFAEVTPAEGEGFSDGNGRQEWVCSSVPLIVSETTLEHAVKIEFTTDIFGTFRQSVVFDFNEDPVLVKHICVDVIPVTDADKIQEIKKEIVDSAAERWDEENSDIVHFSSNLTPHMQVPTYQVDAAKEKELLERYPCPRAATFQLTQTTYAEKKLTRNNYRSRMHELLYVEEIARYDQIARYNLTSTLKITNNYLLTPSGMATSTAKYSHSGELFACLPLSKDVSEDTSAGRLILNNCVSVLISSKDPPSSGKKRKVYEAIIEDKGKNVIYLRVSAPAVTGLGLKAETDFTCDIQFQPSRLSYCEWHQAIDKIADFKIIFPETAAEPCIPWTPQRQWDTSLDARLNAKQKEAIMAITTPVKTQLPPILLIGPFGTGKTYTLAQALKQLVQQPEARVLICTHSNSAADLYIKDYLHPWVEEGIEAAKPLRVYYHKRWVATVNQIVQKYCLIDLNGNVRNFRRPSAEDIMKHRIVVVTLNISMELATLDLPKGHFTHILLDEAAQAMECEAIMPLALASDTTRIVLAGDHMQMSPEIFSNFAKERKLHVSLLERLYDYYPSDFPCKILLCENYRAHEAIIKYTSELFYEQKLVASGKIPRHEKYYPLTFFTTRGEDVQDRNSTTFYNNAEVYEVVERVSELRKKWPSSWGKINDQSIGIMTPYADQVFRIRSELRKRRMAGISVERVLNVQGKQFRAIFLSTVRTRRTCSNSTNSKDEEVDYGFLSNSKLLNTAITRAQSLVAVVGDPIALCSIGKCRKIWERFIEICNQNKSLFGITWSLLRSQLDGVELKKTYVLNPNAPEFIPRALMHESYLRGQTDAMHQYAHGGHHTNQYHHHHSNFHSSHHGPVHNYRQSSGMMNTHIPRPIDSQHPIPPQSYQNGPQQHHGIPPTAQHPQSQGQQYPYQNPQQMYFSGGQSAHQMMRGPPPPITQGPYSQGGPNTNPNMWGHSFPVVPSPGRNTPPGWRGAKPYMNQPPGIRAPNLNHQRQQIPPPQAPSGQQPLRSPGSVTQQHMQMPYSMHKPQVPPQIQYPPNAMRNVAAATAASQVSPAAFPQPQAAMPQTYNEQPHYHQMAQEMLNRNPQMMSMVGPQQNIVSGPQQQQPTPPKIYPDKDYQFLQNVHFPAKAPVVSTASRPAATLSSQSDLSHLLPSGMSFSYDFTSKENQIKWFMRLTETLGLEAANKYTEILRQVPTATAPQQPKTMPNSSDQLDMWLDDLMKSPTSEQSLLKDILGYPQNSVPSSMNNQMTNNGYINQQASKTSLDSELFGSKPIEHQSVPLYRRQAGQSYATNTPTSSKTHSMTSSTPPDMMDQSIMLESIEKLSQNFQASMFATGFGDQNGYAHGLPSIQSIAANLSQQGNYPLHHSHHPSESQMRNHFVNQQHLYNQQQVQREQVEDFMRQGSASATYASVLSGAGGLPGQLQNKSQGNNKELDPKDPFVSNFCASLGKSNGYYNYFQ